MSDKSYDNFIAAMLRDDPQAKAAVEKREAKTAACKKELVDRVLLESFGIADNHSDGISSAHPILAGVARRALREAFDAGVSHTVTEMVKSILEEKSKGR